jgi:hypothetical protein
MGLLVTGMSVVALTTDLQSYWLLLYFLIHELRKLLNKNDMLVLTSGVLEEAMVWRLM